MKLLLLLLFIIIEEKNYAHTIIVNESSPKSSLQYYLCEEGQKELKPHTTLYLLDSQEHILPVQSHICLIRNKENLTLTSNSTQLVTVSCGDDNSTRPNSGLGFFNIHTLNLQNIRFSSCGGRLPSQYFSQSPNDQLYFHVNQFTTLLFRECSNIYLTNITITNYLGFATIFINPTGQSVLETITMNVSYHRRECQSNYTISCSGSGIIIYYRTPELCPLKHSSSTHHCMTTESNINSTFTIKKSFFEYNLNIPKTESLYADFPNIMDSNNIPISTFGGTITAVFNEGTYAAKITIYNTIFRWNVAKYFGSLAAIFYNAPLESSLEVSGSEFHIEINTNGAPQYITNSIGISIYRNHTRINKKKTEWQPVKFRGCNFYHHSFSTFETSNQNKLSNFGIIYMGITGCIQSYENVKVTIFLTDTYYKRIFIGYQYPFLYAETRSSKSCSDICSLKKQFNLIITNCTLDATSSFPSTFSTLNLGKMIFKDISSVSFEGTSNNFSSQSGSVIQAFNTDIYFKGTQYFYNNRANYGAAVNLKQSSHLYIYYYSKILFEENHALFAGGAIYAEDDTNLFANREICAIQLVSENNKSDINTTIKFINNSAILAGNSIYAVPLYQCSQQTLQPNDINLFDLSIFSFNDEVDNGLPSVASVPVKICLCNQSTNSISKQCIQQEYTETVAYPGSTIKYGVFVRDLNGSFTYGAVEAYLLRLNEKVKDFSDLIPLSQRIQQVYSNSCTELIYTLQSQRLEHGVLLELHLAVVGQVSNLSLNLNITPHCPSGFSIDNETGICKCSPFLRQHGIEHCDIQSLTIVVPKGVWIGKKNGDIIFSPSCPPDYCINERSAHTISITNMDDLCRGNRHGMLCGKCRKGYSHVMGSQDCYKCTNRPIMYEIPVYLLSGVVFVLLLYIFKFTIELGTIGGLVFWLDIFSIVILSPYKTGTLGTIPFIMLSALNYWLFAPVCLWNGLDSLSKAAVLFIFPLYLWVLVGIIILASNCSSTIANWAVGSSVQVLATLMYFSYSEVLFASLNIILPTKAYYDSCSDPSLIWYSNGEIMYGENVVHLVLVIVSLLAVCVYTLPGLLIGFFGAMLLRNPCFAHYCRPFVNAFQGPYKSGMYYWFGLRLAMMCLLQLLIPVLGTGKIQVLVSIIILIVFAMIQASQMPFQNTVINYLDLWFQFLLVLPLITLLGFGPENYITVNVTPLLALIPTIGIILYHIMLAGHRMRCLRRQAQEFKNALSYCYDVIKMKWIRGNKKDGYEPIGDNEIETDGGHSGLRDPLDISPY